MPVSLLDAIKTKYEDHGDEFTGSEVVVFVTQYTKSTAKDGLVIPPILTLNSAEINEGGEAKELREVCKNVYELDLTDNLLTEWSEVFDILNSMPKVHFINLSGNSLSHSCGAPSKGQEFDRVTHLILNSTGISWSTALQLLQWFPSLQELHLSLNGYKTLTFEDTVPYESLKQIFLNRNLLKDWSEICRLGEKFPNMDHIVVLGNPFEVLTGDFSLLQNLSAINITQTEIKSWEELAKFSVLENLMDLRLKSIPLVAGLGEKEARQLSISYLPNVGRLNGSIIHEEERVDAERAFIRRFMDSEEKPPRFFELEIKYGKVDPLASVNLSPPTKAKVNLEYMETKQEVEITLANTIVQLKKELEQYVGMPAKSFRLYHLDSEGWMGKDELKAFNFNRTCHSIPIRDGDTLEIVLK